jgi:succinyl-diaminopimelate desuccinylase
MKYQQQIEAYVAENEQTLIDAVCRLVSVRSVKEDAAPGMPFGPGPAAALDESIKLAKEWGFTSVKNHEGYVGTVDLNGNDTFLHILGHLDVVNEGTGWTVTAPYAPKVVDGLLYGRGVADDKGPCVAALLAMKCIKDLGIPMKSNVRLILGTDEESGSEDLDYYFAHNPHAPHSFTPDCSFPVINTEKGSYRPFFSLRWPETQTLPHLVNLNGGIRFNVLPGDADCDLEGLSPEELRPIADKTTAETGVTFILTLQNGLTHIAAKGIPSHAAFPSGGVNAITGLLTLLGQLPLTGGAAQAIAHLNALFPHGDYLGKALGIAQQDEISDELTLAFSLLEFTPTGMTGRFDSRVPICATRQNCSDVVEAAFRARGFSVEGEMHKAHHTPGDSPFVRTLLECCSNYTDLPKTCYATGGGTYVHDIPGGVAFGAGFPGFDSREHSSDECIKVEHLMTAVKIFAQSIAELCGI